MKPIFMAARGRKKGNQPPKSARERKAAFDARMRGLDPDCPSPVSRTPSVFYLSDEAKEIIKRHRELRPLDVSGPTTDSEFIERLIIEYDKSAMRINSSKTVVSKLAPPPARFLRIVKNLNKRCVQFKAREIALSSQVEELVEKLADMSNPIDKEGISTISDLIVAHDELPPILWAITAREIASSLGINDLDKINVNELQKQIRNYIQKINQDLHNARGSEWHYLHNSDEVNNRVFFETAVNVQGS